MSISTISLWAESMKGLFPPIRFQNPLLLEKGPYNHRQNLWSSQIYFWLKPKPQFLRIHQHAKPRLLQQASQLRKETNLQQANPRHKQKSFKQKHWVGTFLRVLKLQLQRNSGKTETLPQEN